MTIIEVPKVQLNPNFALNKMPARIGRHELFMRVIWWLYTNG